MRRRIREAGDTRMRIGRTRVTRWLTGTKFKGTEGVLPGQNGNRRPRYRRFAP